MKVHRKTTGLVIQFKIMKKYEISVTVDDDIELVQTVQASTVAIAITDVRVSIKIQYPLSKIWITGIRKV
jgi:hypothetical protein